jgi:hypothetical protein
MRKSPSPIHGRSCRAKRPPSAAAQDPTMDIERINAIGSSLADLSERTSALRGYL